MRKLLHFFRRCRSAVTGRFVSKSEAVEKPNETVCERVVLRDEGDL